MPNKVINSKDYWNERFESNDWEKMYGKEQTVFFTKIALNLIPDWIKDDIKSNHLSIIDMGCALGQGTSILNRYFGFPICGADFSPFAVEEAKKNYLDNDFKVIDITNIPETINYDVVYCSNVIEHFSNPWTIVSQFSKVAEKYIILLFPFEETIDIKEHQYKFKANNIPLFVNDFFLIYENALDASDLDDTLYADNQILLIYARKDGLYDVNLSDISDGLLNLYHKKNQKDLKNELEVVNKKIEKLDLESSEKEEKIRKLEETTLELKKEYEIISNSIWGKIFYFFQFKKIKYIVSIYKNEGFINFCYLVVKKVGMLSLLDKVLPYKIKMNLRERANNQKLKITHNDAFIIENNITEFMKGVCTDDKIWLVISGVKYIDSEGQRNIRLIHEAIKKDIKIIFAYWRWDVSEPVNMPSENMVEIPLDYLFVNRSVFFEKYLVQHQNKSLIIEFPHPYAEQILDIANCFGWVSIYDVIDDWYEFSKRGQAVWYNGKVESRIANNVDINVATAVRLKDKLVCQIYDQKPFYIISNGVDPQRIRPVTSPRNKKKSVNELNIGYFGHLTEAWFDWNLLIELARRKPKWTFHIIGYGEPENLKTPSNIILYGKKKPDELAEYASNWNVAIIPFINCELTLSVNPIKIYEYLQLKLPVVASNMPEVANVPYTKIAIGVDAFEKAIEESAILELNEDVINSFIEKNTWSKKCDRFIKIINEFEINDSYKQLLK